MHAAILFEVHAVVGEEYDLGLRAAFGLNPAQQRVERAERDAEAFGAAYVKKSVRRLDEAEEVARAIRRDESLAKSLHVGLPDRFGRDVDQELERQRLLIIKLVHVRRRDFAGRATTHVLAD